MTAEIHNISSKDQLPLNREDYKRLLLASAYATSQTNRTDAGFVLDTDENTKWTSNGLDESLTVELPSMATINRIDIEWDPTLSRTGRYTILFSEDNNLFTKWLEGTMNTALFAHIKDSVGIRAQYIRIGVNGNAENALNGITNVSVYGDDGKTIEETKQEISALKANDSLIESMTGTEPKKSKSPI